MQQRYPLGPYLPDLPSIGKQSVQVARNALPREGGWTEQKGFSQITDFTALDDRARGAISLIDDSGNPHHFVGTATKLYHQDTETRDVTRLSGGAYNAVGSARWEFVVFEKTIIAINPFDEPQYFTLNLSTNFDRLDTAAPRAAHQGVIGRHVVFGNTSDPIDGPVPNRLWWPAIGNPFYWPNPRAGSPEADDATQVQSGFVPLEGDGGPILRVVSGAEVGGVFQKNAIWRMDYVGSPNIYEVNRVEPNRGLLVPGVAVPVSRWIFFLAEDGFYIFDYTSSTPIGKDQINKTFFADVDLAYADRISAVPNPDQTRIYVLYPGSGHTGGAPNKWLCYDWALQRWGHGELDAELLVQALPPGVHLDNLPYSNIDAPGLASWDDAVAGAGSRSLAVYDHSHFLGTLSGTPLTATFETDDLELSPGRRSLLNYVRPLVRGDNSKITVQASSRGRYQDDIEFGLERTIDAQGDAGIRQDGRYHRVRVNVDYGFDEAIGFDAHFTRGGWR